MRSGNLTSQPRSALPARGFWNAAPWLSVRWAVESVDSLTTIIQAAGDNSPNHGTGVVGWMGKSWGRWEILDHRANPVTVRREIRRESGSGGLSFQPE